MREAHVVEIITPQHYLLNGLWFGPLAPKRVFVFIHGLTGSAFSMSGLIETLIDQDTAALTFNNRGSEQVTSIKRHGEKEVSYITAGAAHEVFTDCIDDIEGALKVARESGAQEICLVGHSTGAQKSIYWSATGGAGVSGIILLGPLSDYSGALKTMDPETLQKGVAHARELVAAGKPHQLMPEELREWFACDAQRYLSLYTPDTAEDIFPYAFPEKKPAVLESVSVPVMVFLAGNDEYGDKPACEIAAWFDAHIAAPHRIEVISGATHSFKDCEAQMVEAIKGWIQSS